MALVEKKTCSILILNCDEPADIEVMANQRKKTGIELIDAAYEVN